MPAPTLTAFPARLCIRSVAFRTLVRKALCTKPARDGGIDFAHLCPRSTPRKAPTNAPDHQSSPDCAALFMSLSLGPFPTCGATPLPAVLLDSNDSRLWRSEERRVGKECRSRWSP